MVKRRISWYNICHQTAERGIRIPLHSLWPKHLFSILQGVIQPIGTFNSNSRMTDRVGLLGLSPASKSLKFGAHCYDSVQIFLPLPLSGFGRDIPLYHVQQSSLGCGG